MWRVVATRPGYNTACLKVTLHIKIDLSGTPPRQKENNMNTTTPATCKCNCGQTVGPKATYRPGHDARHVSDLLATIVEHQEFDMITKYQTDLPSTALKEKFANAVENYLGRKAKKSAGRQSRTEWVDSDTDSYKVGRWNYPTQVLMYREGLRGLKPGQESEYLDIRRNTKRDGSGEWVALEGGELVAH